jgi:hypothetical protein
VADDVAIDRIKIVDQKREMQKKINLSKGINGLIGLSSIKDLHSNIDKKLEKSDTIKNQRSD